MWKLNVDSLVKSLTALETYAPPIEGSPNVNYLYVNLYLHFYAALSDGAAMRIRDIDVNAFTLEDVSDFEDYYNNGLCQNGITAYGICEKLRKLAPAVSKTQFI